MIVLGKRWLRTLVFARGGRTVESIRSLRFIDAGHGLEVVSLSLPARILIQRIVRGIRGSQVVMNEVPCIRNNGNISVWSIFCKRLTSV
jgi:hypothetical protein